MMDFKNFKEVLDDGFKDAVAKIVGLTSPAKCFHNSYILGQIQELANLEPVVIELRTKVAELEAETLDYATNIQRLLETIKYVRGIAERGLSVECPEDQTVESFVLGYVKQLETENAQLRAEWGEPVAWRMFDGEGGYDYCGYTDNEDYRDEFIKRNPSPTYKNWVEPLYALEKK